MQFISNGPDVPDSLLQAHEEGNVVFFCGAGISYPAKLPGFQKLVERIYDSLGMVPNEVQRAAIKSKQYDTAIGLLESHIAGGRKVGSVRLELAKILTPDFTARNSLATHKALLQLSKSRSGHTRLVTTNFDRIFEEVIEKNAQNVERYSAPLLPVPKNRWDGLVYLHGLLSKSPIPSELDDLVISSGDFGLAYLSERWAARFVSELFRNYTVCFIGYSLNDPVLRYMMDALAADALLGESTPEMFAFGSYSKGKEDKVGIEWKAKNVTPILYKEHYRHHYLHETLRAWSETYRDGISGKERIVHSLAITRPSASTRQDNFVDRMLWALSDDSGHPAKTFAEFNPVPAFEWLDVFADEKYALSDLSKFKIHPHEMGDKDIQFSLIKRPSPYWLAPWMTLVSRRKDESQWDKILLNLSRWIVRHLNEPKLLLWFVDRGAQLHGILHDLIERKLKAISTLESEGRESDIEEIRKNAPNEIPSSYMYTMWRLLLTGRVKTLSQDMALYTWIEHLNLYGLTTSVRLELREILTPKVRLYKSYWYGENIEKTGFIQHDENPISWELELSVNDAHHVLYDSGNENWKLALPVLLDDFELLLLDSLNLMRELEGTDEYSDHSSFHIPSIVEHWQNNDYYEWVVLIRLLRDSWLAIYAIDYEKASRIALRWYDLKFPVFKRLALFASSFDSVISPSVWTSWLLAEDAWSLWSSCTRRETFRLLIGQGRELNSHDFSRLEQAILKGPPGKVSSDNLEQQYWDNQKVVSIWLRLAKLAYSEESVSSDSLEILQNTPDGYKGWEVERFEEQNEFNSWSYGSDDPGFESNRRVEIAPYKRAEIVEWLRQNPESPDRIFKEDTWLKTCRLHPMQSSFALLDLGKSGDWLTSRWNEAIRSWTEEDKAPIIWRHLGACIVEVPDDHLRNISPSLSRFLKLVSKTIELEEGFFVSVCSRLINLEYEEEGIFENSLSRALNHPIGHLTQALISIWFKKEPNDNDGMPTELKTIFSKLCNVENKHFRNGRVILSSQLIGFFRVDNSWTRKNLLPLYDWKIDSSEALAMWEGFLWSPRLYSPLLKVIKSQFLDSADFYELMGSFGRQYAAMLVYSALDPADNYTDKDFQCALEAIPEQGREEAIMVVYQALEGATQQNEQYWKNRILPFLKKIWPKPELYLSDRITGSMARICIAAGDNFPEALQTVQIWLRPIRSTPYLLGLLNSSKLSIKYPEPTLQFLDSIIDSNSGIRDGLSACLDQIKSDSKKIVDDPRYKKLENIVIKN